MWDASPADQTLIIHMDVVFHMGLKRTLIREQLKLNVVEGLRKLIVYVLQQMLKMDLILIQMNLMFNLLIKVLDQDNNVWCGTYHCLYADGTGARGGGDDSDCTVDEAKDECNATEDCDGFYHYNVNGKVLNMF